MTSESG